MAVQTVGRLVVAFTSDIPGYWAIRWTRTNRHNQLYGTALLTVVPQLGNKFAQNIVSPMCFWLDIKFQPNPSDSLINAGTKAEVKRENNIKMNTRS